MNQKHGHSVRFATIWASASLLCVSSLFGQASKNNGENEEQTSEVEAPPVVPEVAAEAPAEILTPPLAPFERLMAIVLNEGLDLGDRTTAADQVVEMALRDAEDADLLGHVFLDPDIDSGPVRLIARSVARRSVAPSVLTVPLIEFANRLPDAEAVEVIGALGSIRTQASCAALIGFASSDQSSAMQIRAFDALWRLTAMRSLGVDHESWRAWFEGASTLEPAQWNLLLLDNLARERDVLVRTRSADMARLIEVATQLNLATPSEQRSVLLASYLLDRRDELRELGFDLVERELRQSAQLNGEVAQATIRLLMHADPSARRRAARVLDQIAPPEAGPAIAQALAAELDPIVAADLLKASIRWPSAALEEPVIRWLAAGESTFGPAARAALELDANGLLTDEDSLSIALGAIREREVATLSESSLALLASIGDDSDRARIAGLLASDDIQVSRAAAMALSDRADYLDRILFATEDRGHLLAIAADAVLSHRPTAAGYLSIAELLVAPEGESRDTALLVRIAVALSVGDLYQVAMKESDLTFRQQLLLRLVDDDFVVADADQKSHAMALAELAHLQTMHGQSDAALLTLDKLPEVNDLLPDRLVLLRATALIAANRLDDARQLKAKANAWLDALEYLLAVAPNPQLAQAIVKELTSAYADAMNDGERERLAVLSAAVTQLVSERESTDGGDPDDPDDPGTPPKAEGSGGG